MRSAGFLAVLAFLLLMACHPLSLPWEKEETSRDATSFPAEDALNVLIGLNESQIEQRLGTPARISEASAATVWEYRYNYCRLALYFYLNLQTEEKQILVYDLKSGEDTKSARQYCVKKFLS